MKNILIFHCRTNAENIYYFKAVTPFSISCMSLCLAIIERSWKLLDYLKMDIKAHMYHIQMNIWKNKKIYNIWRGTAPIEHEVMRKRILPYLFDREGEFELKNGKYRIDPGHNFEQHQMFQHEKKWFESLKRKNLRWGNFPFYDITINTFY